MVKTAILGYPRMGPGRELKRALEKFWSSSIDERALLEEASKVRVQHWQHQAASGIDFIPVGDFSLYDHVLDTAVMIGAVPERYGTAGTATAGAATAAGGSAGTVSLAAYFAMARGGSIHGREVGAMEMTKWFDTNYHFIVPELSRRQTFRLSSTHVIDAFQQARGLGIKARPVLVGPITFLSLAKSAEGAPQPLLFLEELLPVYEEVLRRLAAAGAEWVQVDEPILVTDVPKSSLKALGTAYSRLAKAGGPKIMLATYFGDLGSSLDTVLKLPVDGLHVDLVRGPGQADRVLKGRQGDTVVSLGLIDGRNVWRADLDAAIRTAERFVEHAGADRVVVSSSCSLLHSPEDLTLETGLDPEIKGWLAFARQKTAEVATVARALNQGAGTVAAELEENRRLLAGRKGSSRVTNPAVKARLASLTPALSRRNARYAERRRLQSPAFGLPLFPTTTIGSFPQTPAVRSKRAEHRAGTITRDQYEAFLKEEIERTVRMQESVGLDVLVHGEFERNDMVEYFGEMLSGFVFTRGGWVQSYGSRCVKPPIIYGDVARPKPMTVRWSSYAQSLTKRPMKGMLTGPVTILMWSFVRDDQPREVTCRQIALALRDEVVDLESAGIRMIQIDEPALREGLPLKAADRRHYLDWAVEAFRIASSGVKDETQVHTHMCYSEFNDIVPSIAAMDADVISIESARSRMELLGAFRSFRYPNEIGPGVYDIHSPRVPSAEEMEGLLEKALEVLKPSQLWVNPDCGLKTRQWKETEPSLAAMVKAARALRERHAAAGDGTDGAAGARPAAARKGGNRQAVSRDGTARDGASRKGTGKAATRKAAAPKPGNRGRATGGGGQRGR